MNVCENEAVIAFDTLYTQNHIQILKILLPYFDPYGQNPSRGLDQISGAALHPGICFQASVPSIQKSNLRHILAGLCRVV